MRRESTFGLGAAHPSAVVSWASVTSTNSLGVRIASSCLHCHMALTTAGMGGTKPKSSSRACLLQALALATLPLAAGYVPARPPPHSVLARRQRAPASWMGADYTGLSYRELQVECKARGLKATGKTDVLRARLAATPAAAAAGAAAIPAAAAGAGAPAAVPAAVPEPAVPAAPAPAAPARRVAPDWLADEHTPTAPVRASSREHRIRRRDQSGSQPAPRREEGRGHRGQGGSQPGASVERRGAPQSLQCPSCRLELSDKGRRRHMAFCCPVRSRLNQP